MIVANNLQEEKKNERHEQTFSINFWKQLEKEKIFTTTAATSIECNNSCLNRTNIELHDSTLTIRGTSQNTVGMLAR